YTPGGRPGRAQHPARPRRGGQAGQAPARQPVATRSDRWDGAARAQSSADTGVRWAAHPHGRSSQPPAAETVLGPSEPGADAVLEAVAVAEKRGVSATQGARRLLPGRPIQRAYAWPRPAR